jgi:hypothetical protein
MGKVGAYVALPRNGCKRGIPQRYDAIVARNCGLDRVTFTWCVCGRGIMLFVKSAMVSAVVIGLFANVLPGQAQQQAQLPARTAPQIVSKTDLAARFAQIKTQYVMLKMSATRFLPPSATDSVELKQARLQLASVMRSYEYYEGQTQIQRDNLNTLTALTEAESMRMQIALNRMDRLQTILANQIKKLSDTGDAIVQNTN